MSCQGFDSIDRVSTQTSIRFGEDEENSLAWLFMACFSPAGGNRRGVEAREIVSIWVVSVPSFRRSEAAEGTFNSYAICLFVGILPHVRYC